MMTTVSIVESRRAILPETNAYQNVLEPYFEVELIPNFNRELRNRVVWCFMGMHRHRPNCRLLIHDYRSLSTGFACGWRDFLKRKLNAKPDIRVFLNPDVERMMGFRDEVPSFMLDMGIPSSLLQAVQSYRPASKSYRFAYMGEVSRERQVDRMIDCFLKSPFRRESMLLVGRVEPAILERFSEFPNLHFVGLIPQSKLFPLLMAAEFGISVLPNKRPYQYQTATKLLEYAALGMKILANRGDSMVRSAEAHGIKVGWAGDHIFDVPIDLDSVPDNSEFDPSALSWECMFRDSGLLDYLITRAC